MVARAGYLVTTIDEGFPAQVGGKVPQFQCINSFKRQDLGRMNRCQLRAQASRRRIVFLEFELSAKVISALGGTLELA